MPNQCGNAVAGILRAHHERQTILEPPISVDIVKEIIQDQCELTSLVCQEVDVDTPNLYGYVKFYYPVPESIRVDETPTTAIIRFKKNLNFCWRRFVVCKELCHCLIDDSRDERIAGVDSLKLLLQYLAARIDATKFVYKPFASEQWAEIMALEILFPYELRRQYVEKLKDGTITPYNLALRYRIPTEYAEIGMYDSFLDFAREFRGDTLLV